ncbi:MULTISPECIES: periplasmic heavy metal sensor [Thalassospira]|uniref:Periplasmic heavy metal sensor n=2 Tax=Thalassospira TaxID=168934 RepID=A0A367WHC1_9PROT|nr:MULTISPECIES: periplasmic heavy metal sensor [Thalassospira]MDG4718948.1 periplasmic heavy metal sensor [Thalassospira sp. FZY0004]RCK39910.1 hypothetical protein TH19_02400 [Thalassospira profundimaris]
MSFAFRRVSTMRKLMWASLAINLFLAGALAGNLVSGYSMFRSPMPPPPPGGFDDEPPGIRMLKNVRTRLSDEGKVIFDAEFNSVIAEIRSRPSPRLLTEELRSTLDDPEASDTEVRAAYAGLKEAIQEDLTTVLGHMANAAIALSPEDRRQMIFMGPGDMPPPPRQ